LATIGIFAIITGMKCQHISTSTVPKGVADCISLSSEEDDTLSFPMHSKGNYSIHSKRDHEQDTKYPLGLLCRFTTSFAAADLEKINTQFHFDTDLVLLFVTTQRMDISATT
jgi:hypothetical protein